MLIRTTPQKPQDGDLDRFRFRIACAAGAVVLAFALLVGRFVFLQVFQHEYYTTRAEDNRISLVPIPPNRGIIEDRNGVVLARNYSAFTLEITPSKVEDLDETIDALGELVEIQPKDRRRFRKLLEESRSFESLPIRTRLSDEEVARFAANRYRFPGVEVKARLFRQYPLGPIAAHAIGYINRINKADLESIEEKEQSSNYKGTEHIGKTGLEKTYEFQLHGETGYEKVETDAGGRAVRSLSRTAPTPGSKLTLTLDVKLQEMAEKAFGDRRGALVAIEPATGGILALVSTPDLRSEPVHRRHPLGGLGPAQQLAGPADGQPRAQRRLPARLDLQSRSWRWRRWRPASARRTRPSPIRASSPSAATPSRDDKKGGHGMVDMYKSIVQSCDTYYYMLANDMGIDAIARFMKPLGLGSRTGIDIDGESEGVLPSPEWKKKRFKRPEQQKWFGGETISIGIGQGYNAVHADPAGAGDGDAGQRRRAVPPAPRQVRHRQPHPG